jgi:hypothetical protein
MTTKRCPTIVTKIFIAATIATSIARTASAAPLFFNGFETDIAGWETPSRVPSGTNLITSKTGDFHATTAGDPFGGAGLTRWGGYNYGAGNAIPTTFKEYTTSVDVYLNVAGGFTNNTRFDFDSAINTAAGTHRRDFIFNAGFYNDSDGSPGSGSNRFVITASNNTQPGSAFAKNPGRSPIAISTSGWYTFKHRFYNNGGVLAVEMTIVNAANAVVGSWLLSDPTDVITNIGGNRYGWFNYSEFSTLAFDNSQLRLAAVSLTAVGFRAPMDSGPVAVKKKSNRVLPFKMQILKNGVPQTPSDIAAPVIEIQFNSEPYVGPTADNLLSSGQGDDGNQFSYNSADQTWQFNLNSRQFTAPGTYTVTAISGDSAEYTLNIITGQFIIQ